MGFIYKIYNDVNDDVYIGQTMKTINERWNAHLSNARTPDTHLYFAMQKYGTDHFFIEQIEECDNSLLDDREIYWISYFDSYKNGYNETLGGDGNRKYNPEVFIDLWNDGFTCNEIAESVGCAEPTVRSWLKSSGISKEETINRRASKHHKKVLQYDLSGNLLHSFNSVLEVTEFFGYTSGSSASLAIKYHYNLNGSLLVFEDDIQNVSKYINAIKYNHGRKPVLQYTTKGIFVACHDMIKNAANAVGGKEDGIIKACKYITVSYKDFLWKYDTDNTDVQQLVLAYNNQKILGVYLNKKRNKWFSQLCVNYKQMRLGTFDTKEAAITARLIAEYKYLGESSPQKYLFEQYNIEELINQEHLTTQND